MTEISELFARDPLSLTRDDISKIISYYREKRAQFNAGIKPETKAKKTTGTKLPKSETPIDLGDLGL